MKNKKMCVALSALFLTAGALGIVGCGSGGTEDGYEKLSSKDLPATTSVISVKDYRDKVKGGIAGAMTGVAYGFPLEFIYKTWTPESQLPVWKENMIRNGYDQDDVYLAVTAIEALDDLGLDVTSRRLGLYMYNKDFEFWNGSNNDALARGYAPPFAGYPKQSTPHYTCAYSDGNSYQCGALFGGLLGLNMTGFANEICQKFGEICTYGDGIYSTQFIAAMYGEAFFTNDVQRIIDAGLAAIPADSWSALIIQDVLSNYGKGMSAEQNFTEIETKWIRNPEYNWTVWPNGDNVTPGTGILLDAKCCSAFTVLGLLYGEGDIEKSMKITVQCANDSDSTAAATAGILATVQGFEKLDGAYKNGLIADQKIKYSRSTVNSLTDTCEKLMKDVVKRTGGKVAYVDGALSFVIPESAKKAEIEEYKCSKNPAPMEVATYTQEEMDQMRLIADPGFRRTALFFGIAQRRELDLSRERLDEQPPEERLDRVPRADRLHRSEQREDRGASGRRGRTLQHRDGEEEHELRSQLHDKNERGVLFGIFAGGVVARGQSTPQRRVRSKRRMDEGDPCVQFGKQRKCQDRHDSERRQGGGFCPRGRL